MTDLKRVLEVVGTACLWALIGVGVLFLGIIFYVPLWYVLLMGASAAACLIYKKKRSIMTPAVSVLGAVLLVSYFVLEFVPSGNVRADQVVNSITFREICGSYYRGDGLGVSCILDIQPDGRFFFTWNSCTRTSDRNKGNISVTDDTLTLHPKKPNRQDGFRGTPTVFVPIKWDDRVYLVPVEKMAAFCSMIRIGMEPRKQKNGMFYLRREDWKKPCSGLPVVGTRWKNIGLSQPTQSSPKNK